MEALEKYLRETGMGVSGFAAALGVDHSLVSKWYRGKTRPGWEMAAKIERITRGKVPLKAWPRAGADQVRAAS